MSSEWTPEPNPSSKTKMYTSRPLHDPTMSFVLMEGDRVGKWGSREKPGYDGYADMTVVTVVRLEDGVVTLDLSNNACSWWADVGVANTMRHQRTGEAFSWCHVGVHTVYGSSARSAGSTRLIADMKHLLKDGFNDALFIPTYVLHFDHTCRPSKKMCDYP
jgi:hypothetical protein